MSFRRLPLFGEDLSESSDLGAEGPGYVYLIWFVFFEGGECYKIGHSARPDARFRKLKSVLPGYSELFHLIETDNMRNAEALLHKKHEQKRFPGSGEWFRLDPKEVLGILEIREIRFSRDRLQDDIIHYDPRSVAAFKRRFGPGGFERWLKGELQGRSFRSRKDLSGQQGRIDY